ncbi:MAG TPA: Rossmann-like and DUF2520 domain-containing protein [Actinomycetota bacterium]|nr:Rossmann-like and DUF2520 domain-containing protein [Actinomycetota bacterium]
MTAAPRPFSADHPSQRLLPPRAPYDVAVVGAGRVGQSFARALERAGHTIVAELHRDDDPSPISSASVVIISVPDDALFEAAGVVARLGRPGAVVVHTCGLLGVEPLQDCGSLVAAIHPAVPVAAPGQDLSGVCFGVTCAEELREWCESFVSDLGGTARMIGDDERTMYHAALAMASNFAVSLAGDAAEILGGHDLLVPLLRATVENIAALGPDAALTGPVVRGDTGTVRAHVAALPPDLLEVYVSNAKRALARAVASGRLDQRAAAKIRDVLEEALVR